MTAPELPEPDTHGHDGDSLDMVPYFTADQLRAYGEACAAAATQAERERCIDIVAMFGGSVEIEAAIRRGE